MVCVHVKYKTNNIITCMYVCYLYTGKEMGHILDLQPLYVFEHHEDIVRSIIWHESKIYSAG